MAKRRKIDNRSTMIRTAGIRSADPSKFKNTARVLNEQRMRMAAGTVFNPTHPTRIEGTCVPCPRCNKASCTAKLTNEEEVGYCTSCRYTIPLPEKV